MYENITYESILKRMLDRIPNTFDKREGSVIYDALAPAAMELKLAYIEFDEILNESFADTASRDFLIRRCAERGITPGKATNAVLSGEFTPMNIDVTGQRFSLNKLNYTAEEKIEDGKYKMRCETAGSIGNRYLGTIIPINYINGLQNAELTGVLIPGEDEENTESLRTRYFNSFNEKSFAGNRADYIEKTNAVEGVGAVKVIPHWDGAGTVKLVIIDSDYNKASDELITKVKETLDPERNSGSGCGLAPIGHIVTVKSAAEKVIAINTKIIFRDSLTWLGLQETINNTISDYLYELRKQWADEEGLTIRISQIESRILNINGIIDVSDTAVNGDTKNMVLNEFEIPVLGGVSI